MSEEEKDLFGMPVGLGPKPRCGRTRAVAVLDNMLAMQRNQAALHESLQKKFDADPAAFFKEWVMPLLPKESKVAVASDGIVEWKSLVEAFPRTGPPPGYVQE